jgi:IS1 family transposase
MRLSVCVGQGCAPLHDRLMRDLQVNLIELDEQWYFISKKQRHVKQGDLDECGDVWLLVALAATQKAVLSYVVGKRTAENTEALATDLRRSGRESATNHVRRLCALCRGNRERIWLERRFCDAHEKGRQRFELARRGPPLLARSRDWRRSDRDKRLAQH